MMPIQPEPQALWQTFPPEWQEGLALFNQGKWWEAHEAWEVPWRVARGDDRAALQALILLAAALHKRWRMGSLTGRNFEKARRYLCELPAGRFGIDWPLLERRVAAALALPAEPEEATAWPQIPLLQRPASDRPGVTV